MASLAARLASASLNRSVRVAAARNVLGMSPSLRISHLTSPPDFSSSQQQINLGHLFYRLRLPKDLQGSNARDFTPNDFKFFRGCRFYGKGTDKLEKAPLSVDIFFKSHQLRPSYFQGKGIWSMGNLSRDITEQETGSGYTRQVKEQSPPAGLAAQ
ncbi:hypothetical protein BGZ95_004463, partial [Linnemannia exigua]